MTDPAFVEHALEMLRPLGVVRARAMFGGHGVYLDELFVALVAFEQLWLKVDDQTRPQFAAAGCAPFVYEGKGRPIEMSYWSVPPQAMESPALMQPWARLALEAALRAHAAKRGPATGRKRPTPAKARHRRGTA